MKSKKLKNKIITLDDLAIMVAKGFSDQESRFNKRFDSLEEKFNVLDDKVENLDKAIFELQLRIGSVEERLSSIEKTLGPLLLVVDTLKFNWKDHDMRIARLEKKIGM